MNRKSFYAIVLDYDSEEDVYNVSVPSLPGCLTWGKSKAEALKHAKEVITVYLDTLVDLGDQIPKGEAVERVIVHE